jgi:hypothetical protein
VKRVFELLVSYQANLLKDNTNQKMITHQQAMSMLHQNVNTDQSIVFRSPKIIGMKTLQDLSGNIINNHKKIIKLRADTSPFCRFQNFHLTILIRLYYYQPFVRVSGDYLTEEEIKRKEEIIKKKMWVNSKGFISTVISNPAASILVMTEPSNAGVSHHQFRSEDKSKWAFGHFK